MISQFEVQSSCWGDVGIALSVYRFVLAVLLLFGTLPRDQFAAEQLYKSPLVPLRCLLV